ncbi:hypothetical protein PENNAL_c0037G00801, partial [Penicillium nalgiovense]
MVMLNLLQNLDFKRIDET